MFNADSSKLVSVIIPVYNTEAYVGDMLECVKNQTYKNIEIIVINDGSTDGSQKVIENYEDPRLTLINVENGGVSRARNIGIKASKGSKIFFWDSDDIIELDAIEKCIGYSEANNVNAVLYSYSNRKNGIVGEIHKSVLNGNYYGERIITEIMPHFLGHSYKDIDEWIKNGGGLRDGKEHTALWRIMLDANVIKDNHLEFDENLSLGEDTKFINQYFLYEKSIGYLDECLYYLTIRDSGANLTSLQNVELMLNNKLKLVQERENIARQAKQLLNTNIQSYFQGTNVLSALQLCIRYSKNGGGYFANKYKVNRFISNELVGKSIKEYKPVRGLKSLPFRLLKRCWGLIFFICHCCPYKLLKKFT